MTLVPRLDLRQGQSLVMTPQLQQAIKLLQLSNMELTEYVEGELEQNPLLEMDERDNVPEPEPGIEATPDEDTSVDIPDTATALKEAADTGTDTGGSDSLDVDYDNTYTADAGPDTPAGDGGGSFENWGAGGNFGSGDLPGIDQTLASEKSMRQHLNEQMGMIVESAPERLIGGELIDMLDEAGYLTGKLENIAARLGCTLADVEAMLVKLQTIDPPGLFSRDLKECLSLQLKDLDRLDPAMTALLDNLDLMAARDLKALVKVCGVDADDVRDMVDEVRALDPKPGRAFAHDVAEPVIPDVLMRAAPGGGWALELNSETLPRVLVNNRYYTQISENAKNDEEKRYISECLQTANWLVKSLHQRATTILKVSEEIVRQQDEFFRIGVQGMKPLVLRDIADAIEMHESTVSRVTSNKYMTTPRGIFELKFFFSSSVGGADGGEARAAHSVKDRIKTLVDGEDAKKVLSDDKIVEMLKAENIDVARRTVAKYRGALGIPSSVQRRREKTGDF